MSRTLIAVTDSPFPSLSPAIEALKRVDPEAEPADHLAALEFLEKLAWQLRIGDQHRIGIARDVKNIIRGSGLGHAQFGSDAPERGDCGVE